jgi:hypothetical protein
MEGEVECEGCGHGADVKNGGEIRVFAPRTARMQNANLRIEFICWLVKDAVKELRQLNMQ